MTETQVNALDHNWYEKFSEYGAMQAYEYLDGDKKHRGAQKVEFLSGQSRNPELDYPKIDVSSLVSKEHELLLLKSNIIQNESNEVVSQLYRWRINEKIAELRMLKATADGDMRRFKKYSEFVYGSPSPDIFAYTVNSLRSIALSALDNDNFQIQNAASELLSALPDEQAHHIISSLPDQGTIDQAKQATILSVGDLIEAPDGVLLNANQIKKVFEEALAKLKADGWEVAVDTSSKSGINVDQETLTVKVPESRTLRAGKLKTLIAHEIGTHVGRRVSGERSKLKLLGLGLDRYEKGEEGIATLREQSLSGRVDEFAGLDGHLAIGLAMGLDGVPRDFRGVFEILAKQYTLSGLLGGDSLESAQAKAADKAWVRCIRTFRGTDAKTLGICFTKDIIYREGNIGVWDVVRKNPEEMVRFDIGKYDPANPRHIWILETLGIADSEID